MSVLGRTQSKLISEIIPSTSFSGLSEREALCDLYLQDSLRQLGAEPWLRVCGFRNVNHEKRLERRCRSYPLHMPGVGRLRHASMQACAARFDLGYFGVDPLNLMEAGYARAVVAVINEVIPTQFH